MSVIPQPFQRRSGISFVVLLAAIYGAALLAVRQLDAVPRADVVAAALTVDLVLVVPLLYHLLLVRNRGWPPFSTVPVFLLSLGGASLVLPSAHHGGLDLLARLAAPAEIFLVAFIAQRAWRGASRFRGQEYGAADALGRLRRAAAEIVGANRAADVLAYEIAVFHYALFGGSAHPSENGFTYHRAGNYAILLLGLLFAVIAELVAVHVLVSVLWSPVPAWILTALSVYGGLWILGDFRAMGSRPIRLDAEALHLRLGLRWTLDLPLPSIARVRRLPPGGPLDRPDLTFAVLTRPQFRLDLAAPVDAHGVYGIRKPVTTLHLAVDDPQSFERSLRNQLPPELLPD